MHRPAHPNSVDAGGTGAYLGRDRNGESQGMPGMTQVTPGQFAALKNLCAILSMPLDAVRPDPAVGLRLLTLTYGLPLVRGRERTRAAGNDILAATQPAFDQWSPFVTRLGQIIATMQTFPAWFHVFRMPTDDLIFRYRTIAYLNRSLVALGLVGGASAAGRGLQKASRRDRGVRVRGKPRPDLRGGGPSRKRCRRAWAPALPLEVLRPWSSLPLSLRA